MIDNHDDSDEIDLPVLPAFARLHPNDHPLAVDRGEASGGSGQAAPEHTGLLPACRLQARSQPASRGSAARPLVIEHKAAQATAARSGLMINGEYWPPEKGARLMIDNHDDSDEIDL